LRLFPALVLLGATAVGFGVWALLRGSPAVHVSTAGTTVVVRTDRPSTAYLEYGPTSAYGLFTQADGLARTHRFVLDGLAPNLAYHVRAVTTSGTATATVAGPPPPARATLQITGNHFERDGRPWIPRFTWGSCTNTYAQEAAVGINTFMSSNCGDSPRRQAAAARAVGAVVIPAADQADSRLPTTVGTYVQDEPDSRHVPPARLLRELRAHPLARGLPVFETLSPRLRNGAAYARVTDALGLDVYPVMRTDDDSEVVRAAVAQRAVVSLARGSPTFQWIEAIPPANALDTAAETWMAIVNGARAIGYWTWGVTPFSVAAPTLQALAEVNAALDTFAPAIDAAPEQLTLSEPTVNALATGLNGALYVFAVNTSSSAEIEETFTLPSLAGREVRIFDSDTVLTPSGDAFTDSLPPLAWRVYLVAPAS
jgi:hypothetical protein